MPNPGTPGAQAVWSDNLTVTGPLTDTELRATAVPISGTVTANAGTGTFATTDLGLRVGQIIDEGGTTRTINRAFVTATLSGDTEVVAAQGAGVRIRVLAVTVVATLAVSVIFRSATTAITGTFPLAANGGFVMSNNDHGWFQTTANQALNVNLSLGTSTGVQVVWIQAT